MTSLAVHLKLCIYYVDHFVRVGLASVTVLHSGYKTGLSYWRRRKKVLATSACILYLCCNVKKSHLNGPKIFFSLNARNENRQKKIKIITAIVRISPVHLWYVRAQEVWEESPTLPQAGVASNPSPINHCHSHLNHA